MQYQQGLPQLTFKEAFVKVFKENYCNFTGRARRSEYWWWKLAEFIILFGLYISLIIIGLVTFVAADLGKNHEPPVALFVTLIVILILAALALFLPSLGAQVRRLHDVGKSGWWILLPMGISLASVFIQLATTAGAAALSGRASGEGPAMAAGVSSIIVSLVFSLLQMGASIYLLILCCKDSQPGINKWGDSPKYPSQA